MRRKTVWPTWTKEWKRKLKSAGNLRVVEVAEDIYRVTAEFPSSEKYYDARQKIDKIISEVDYTVIEDDGPQIILRGAGEPGYRLELILEKK